MHLHAQQKKSHTFCSFPASDMTCTLLGSANMKSDMKYHSEFNSRGLWLRQRTRILIAGFCRRCIGCGLLTSGVCAQRQAHTVRRFSDPQ